MVPFTTEYTHSLVSISFPLYSIEKENYLTYAKSSLLTRLKKSEWHSGRLQSVAVRGQVLREGKTIEIPLTEMVPGDVALLGAGDMVPCDGRVLESRDFFLNQALLTGESFPVEKAPGELPEEPDILAAGNTVLLGTSVISGTAKVLMCRTGQNTELGEIADTLLAKAPPTAFEQGTRTFRVSHHARYGPPRTVCPSCQRLFSPPMARIISVCRCPGGWTNS